MLPPLRIPAETNNGRHLNGQINESLTKIYSLGAPFRFLVPAILSLTRFLTVYENRTTY